MYQNSINDKLRTICNELDDNLFHRRLRNLVSTGKFEQLRKIDWDGQLPESPEIIRMVSNALVEAGEYEGAAVLLNAAHRRRPNDFSVNHMLGRLLIQRGDYARAVGFCRAAVALRPESVGARWSMTTALSLSDRRDEASVHLKSLLSSSSLSGKACQALALTLSEEHGDHEAALIAMEKAIELESNNAVYLALYARILSRVGRVVDGIEKVRQAVELDPGSFLVCVSHVDLLCSAGRHGEAVQVCRRGCNQFPSNGLFFFKLSNLLKCSGDCQEALLAAEKAVRLVPGNAKYRLLLSNLYRRGGLAKRAEYHREHAIKLFALTESELRDSVKEDPQSARAHFDLGTNLFQQDRLSEAIESCSSAIELDPDEGEYHDTLASMYFHRRQFWLAIDSWKAAVECEPKNAAYHAKLGRCLVASRSHVEALAFYERSLELNSNLVAARSGMNQLQLAIREYFRTGGPDLLQIR